MAGGEETLFVSNLGRQPQVFPLRGLDGAKVYTGTRGGDLSEK